MLLRVYMMRPGVYQASKQRVFSLLSTHGGRLQVVSAWLSRGKRGTRSVGPRPGEFSPVTTALEIRGSRETYTA